MIYLLQSDQTTASTLLFYKMKDIYDAYKKESYPNGQNIQYISSDSAHPNTRMYEVLYGFYNLVRDMQSH